jgi:hypothetical protein
MYTGVMFNTVMAAIARDRDKKVKFSPPSRVLLGSGQRQGVARKRQETVNAPTFPLTQPAAKCSG